MVRWWCVCVWGGGKEWVVVQGKGNNTITKLHKCYKRSLILQKLKNIVKQFIRGK